MTKTSMKIVFFGNEKLATGIPTPEPLIRQAVEAAGFEIEQIVTGELTELRPHEAQIAVLAAYGRIIPQRVLDEFPLGIINIHPSLLPEYRGPTPIEQAILDGVEKTGVSIMHLTAGMDEGPVYKQKTLHLAGTETKGALTEQLQRLGAEMLQEILGDIVSGVLKPKSQPHPDRATYTSKITKADSLIDWHKSADRLEREIRAYEYWPQSRTTLGSVDVIVTAANALFHGNDLSPGTIKVVSEGKSKALFVGTADGNLQIERLKPVGKKEMPIAAFLAGYRSQITS